MDSVPQPWRDLLAWLGAGCIACFLLLWIWVVLLEYADRRSRRKNAP